jgi:hypothetical protein
LCTQKVSTLLKSVSVSVRLFDNSSQLHSIELKFCAQNCLINISVERRRWEGSVKKWLSYRKNCHYWPDHPWGEVQGFFSKRNFSQNYLKHIWIDSVFNADFEYDISFEPNRSFLSKSGLNRVPKFTKPISRDQCA